MALRAGAYGAGPAGGHANGFSILCGAAGVGEGVLRMKHTKLALHWLSDEPTAHHIQNAREHIQDAQNDMDGCVDTLKSCAKYIEENHSISIMEAHHDGHPIQLELRKLWDEIWSAIYMAEGRNA